MNRPAPTTQRRGRVSRRLLTATLIPVLMLLGTPAASRAAPVPLAPRTIDQTGDMIYKELDVRYQAAASSEVPATVPQALNFDDGLRTLPLSSAALELNDKSIFRMRELTRIWIRRQAENPQLPVVHLPAGSLYASSRGAPIGTPIVGPESRTNPKGTEFLVTVDPATGHTIVTMFDGEATLSDGETNVTVRSGEQGIVRPGQGITLRPILEVKGLVQWWIDYPAVLDAAELSLTGAERNVLSNSLAAYQAGDLAGALTEYPGYPTPATPASDGQKIYLAALFLSVGAVDKAQQQLDLVPSESRSARALRALIQAVAPDLGAAGPSVPGSGPSQAAPAAPAPIGANFTTQNAAPRSGGMESSTHSQPIENVTSSQHILKVEDSSEWLARSYAHQSTNNLKAALAAARAATARSPEFAFAWTRVGELEFSFGRIQAAKAAIDRALQLAPRNAQAHALRGFLLAARNRVQPALASFDRALELDPGLGNAWLGRGLCKRRLGLAPFTSDGAREDGSWLSDLQTAAAVEPRRSLFRSYAGKAFSQAGNDRLARKELDYARQLDPGDPTPWLYSGLANRMDNRINESVRDLERSLELNDNRQVYRSRLLLDQDRAVRSANLARIYQDAGLTDVAYREAIRSLNADYGNASAHQFLADTYAALLDLRTVSLRYETPAVTEYLVANLLADPGVGVLTPSISQQEYTRLFERNRLGFASRTEYLSRGDWSQNAVQYGVFGNTSYAAEMSYWSFNGQRVNQDREQLLAAVRIKQRLTQKDSIYLQSVYSTADYGDLRQYYDPAWANPGLRIDETQEPLLLAGYHRAWSPSSHTLFLAGRLQDTLRVDNPYQQLLVQFKDAQGTVIGLPARATPAGLQFPHFPLTTLDYRSEFEAYTTELQQIWQTEADASPAWGDHTVIVGSRFQTGTFDTRSDLGGYMVPGIGSAAVVTNTGFAVPGLPVSTRYETDLNRFSIYAYDLWQIMDPLWLTVGLSYDYLDYPLNHREPPLAPGQATKELLSPKGGVLWSPLPSTTLRAAYSQSLGGVSLDRSFALEPSQIAGFNQAFRSLVPESVAGSMPAEEFETWGVAWDLKLSRNTYLGIRYDWLGSENERGVGAVDVPPTPTSQLPPLWSVSREHLDFREQRVEVTLNQLVGRDWSFGAGYCWSESDLQRQALDIPVSVTPAARSDLQASLHQVHLNALFNHPSGLFASFAALWTHQVNRGYAPALPGDDFWQLNAFAGYRFPRRRAEVTVGVLNLTDQDYRLNPLSLMPELPRNRTLLASFRFSF